MSSPIGTGAQSVHPRPVEKRSPAERVSVTSLPAQNTTEQTHLHPPKFGGVADALGKAIASGSAPGWMQDAFLFTAKDGASAVLPLEAAVVGGRTQSAYRRDGWMEVQERVFEEVAAAAIWLKGVDFLKDGFKKGQNSFLPQYRHLSPDIAWNRPWGKVKHVDLTAQELFARDRGEINSLLRLKSARWAFSVGLALAGVAYVVPTLNQLKTKAIMSYQMSRRKRSQEGDNVQFGDPHLLTSGAAGSKHNATNAFGQQGSPASALQPVFNQFPFKSSIQLPSGFNSYQPARFGTESQTSRQNPAFGSQNSHLKSKQWPFHKGQSKQAGKNPKFGWSMPGGSLVQGAGHLVDQTAYGSILVVDAGIAGGRSYVASKRSGFETVEVLVRDIGSLYFYILSVPHIMKGLGWAMDAGFKTSVGLEPKIAKAINEAIETQLGNTGKPYTLANIKEVLHGSSAHGLLLPEGLLKTELRKANPKQLADWLEAESLVYLGKNKTKGFIHTVCSSGDIMPGKIQEWLEEIAAGNGIVKRLQLELGDEERKNLGIALKQAFRHTVGLEVDGLKGGQSMSLLERLAEKHPGLAEDLKELESGEAEALNKRITHMAEVDGLDQAHSLFRRTINLLRDKANGHPELFRQADELANWLDNAKNRHLTLEELKVLEPKVTLHQSGPKDLKQVMGKLVELTHANGMRNEKELLEKYQSQLQKLIDGDVKRLFSLAIDQGNESLIQKVQEMLQGGLHHDAAFLRKAQGIVGQFAPDSREFADPGKAAQMREAIGKYGDALLGKLKSLGEKTTENDLKAEMKNFLNLNRNLNYTSRSVALLGTMVCLGWLVPHVQTTITKRLTGKDRNPGIASAANALGYGKNNIENDSNTIASHLGGAKGANSDPPARPLPNGIFVGQTPRRFYPSLNQTAYQS